MFSEMWAKPDFFKVISKKIFCARNVDIDADTNYSELGGLETIKVEKH